MYSNMEETAFDKAKEQGWDLLKLVRPHNPVDKYLAYTVIRRTHSHGKDYATHLYNASTDSFHHGHYDIPTYSDAVLDLADRLA
jgi:hypothetical protein